MNNKFDQGGRCHGILVVEHAGHDNADALGPDRRHRIAEQERNRRRRTNQPLGQLPDHGTPRTDRHPRRSPAEHRRHRQGRQPGQQPHAGTSASLNS